MLTPDVTKKIEAFVYTKPRSIQEIATHLGKNWRTADRYVEEISKNFGTLSTRIFRGGTRGALKIVYWSSVDKISSSVFQEKLEQQIMQSRKKDSFSAFDIYQLVKDAGKSSSIKDRDEKGLADFLESLSSAKKQVLLFSGNLSFINFQNKNEDMLDTIDKLVKKGVSIKVLCRVDIGGKENVEKLLSLNFKNGKEMIEIRHDEHPLRAAIIDNSFMRINEETLPTGKRNEINKTLFLYYLINDKEWVEWLSRLFWKKFSQSVDAKVRLAELNKIKLPRG